MREIDDVGTFDPGPDGRRYVEHLSVPDLSLGTYSLRAGAVDTQTPHAEDEVYLVLRGRARFTAGGDTVDAQTGSCLYVPAHEEHRFHDVTEDLTVVVVFGPAEHARETTPPDRRDPSPDHRDGAAHA